MSNNTAESLTKKEIITFDLPELGYNNIDITHPNSTSLESIKDYLKLSSKQHAVDDYQISQYWALSKQIDAELNKRREREVEILTQIDFRATFRNLRKSAGDYLFR